LVPDGRRLLAAVLVAVVAVGGYTVANARWLRFPYVDYTWPGNDAAPTLPTGPTGDVRSEVRYVAAHRAPGDTILINMLDQYAFAYYWSADRPVFRRGGPSAIRWYVRYPASARIVIAGDRTVPAARAALAHALASTAAGHRIWLVYSHASSDPWPDALAALHLVAVRTGPDRLFVITP
jgi:hypothetical protein